MRIILSIFVLFSFAGFADILCDVTYNVTSVCESDSNDVIYGDVTYRPINFQADPSLNVNETKILGFGSTFTEAWNDAHSICEQAGCTIQSCEMIGDFQGVLYACLCSYGIGGKWKEGNNSCGGYVTTGSGIPKAGINIGFIEPENREPSSFSSALNKVTEVCNGHLQKMENVPSNSVAFVHNCFFVR